MDINWFCLELNLGGYISLGIYIAIGILLNVLMGVRRRKDPEKHKLITLTPEDKTDLIVFNILNIFY